MPTGGEPAVVYPAGTEWVLVRGFHDSGTIEGVYGPYTEKYARWMQAHIAGDGNAWTLVKLDRGPVAL